MSRFVVGQTSGFLEPGRSLGGHSPDKQRSTALPCTIFVADRLYAMRVVREWNTETYRGPGLRSNVDRIKGIRAEAARFIAELEAKTGGNPAVANGRER